MCSLVAETGSNSFIFVSKGIAFENKMDDSCCCLQKQLYLVVFLDEGRVFCFCFILLRLLFVFRFGFGAFLLSPTSMIRKLRALLPRGTSTWSNTEERHWQAKETIKKVRFELEASLSLSTFMYSLVQWNWFSDVAGCTWLTCIQWHQRTNFTAPFCRTQRPWFSGGGTFPRINPRPCERGLRIDLRYVWTPQNGSRSVRKRIFFEMYMCAHSLNLLFVADSMPWNLIPASMTDSVCIWQWNGWVGGVSCAHLLFFCCCSSFVLFFCFFCVHFLFSELKYPASLPELQSLAHSLNGYRRQHPVEVTVVFCVAYIYKQSFAIPGSALLVSGQGHTMPCLFACFLQQPVDYCMHTFSCTICMSF